MWNQQSSGSLPEIGLLAPIHWHCWCLTGECHDLKDCDKQNFMADGKNNIGLPFESDTRIDPTSLPTQPHPQGNKRNYSRPSRTQGGLVTSALSNAQHRCPESRYRYTPDNESQCMMFSRLAAFHVSGSLAAAHHWHKSSLICTRQDCLNLELGNCGYRCVRR